MSSPLDHEDQQQKQTELEAAQLQRNLTAKILRDRLDAWENGLIRNCEMMIHVFQELPRSDAVDIDLIKKLRQAIRDTPIRDAP